MVVAFPVYCEPFLASFTAKAFSRPLLQWLIFTEQIESKEMPQQWHLAGGKLVQVYLSRLLL